MFVPTPDILDLSMTQFHAPDSGFELELELTLNFVSSCLHLISALLAWGASTLFYVVLEMDLSPSCMLGKHSTTDPHPIPFASSNDILGMMQGPASSDLLSKALSASTGDNSGPTVVISSQDCSLYFLSSPYAALPVPLCDQVMTKVSSFPFAL